MDIAKLMANPETQASYDKMSVTDRIATCWRMAWLAKAHDHQIMPEGNWWSIWMMLAGRGAGKTRSASEQLGWWAWSYPETRWLVSAPTSSDVRSTCFEGDSGLLSVIPQELIKDYNKALHELVLINGSLIKGIPASEPSRFRGPQFAGGWADELAAWEYLREAWDMMQFGLRLKLPDGSPTRLICTTTPKPNDLIIELTEREGDDVVMTTASTYTNLDNLADNFRRQILQYEGTKLGRQEIYAEIIDLEEGKVVKRDMFKLWPSGKPFPKFEYIIQSYDCAYTEKLHNDPTAMTTWGVFKAQDGPWSVLLIDCWAEHLEFPGLKEKAIEEFRCVYGEGKDAKRPDMILIEEKAAGLSLIQELRRAHLPVMGWNPGRADKMQRLQITASIFVAGRVWLPESSQRKGFVRDWCEGFLSQICSFPDSTHDDYVDSATQALRYLKDQGFLEIDPPPREDDPDEYADYLREVGHDTRQNPYAV